MPYGISILKHGGRGRPLFDHPVFPVDSRLLLEEIHELVHLVLPFARTRARPVVAWLSIPLLLEELGREPVEVRPCIRFPELIRVVLV